MPSKAQLKARAAFVKNYAKKKKGSKPKINVKKSDIIKKGSKSFGKNFGTRYEPLLVKALQNGFDIPRGWYDLTPAQKLKKLNYFMGHE